MAARRAACSRTAAGRGLSGAGASDAAVSCAEPDTPVSDCSSAMNSLYSMCTAASNEQGAGQAGPGPGLGAPESIPAPSDEVRCCSGCRALPR